MSEKSKKPHIAHGNDRHPPTLIGWIARLLSGAVLLALAISLGVQMLRPYRSTEIRVEPKWEAVRTSATGVLIPATVINRGTDPVRNLTIAFPGAAGNGVDFVVPLLGPDEEVDIVVGFESKPDRLDYRVKSYETP
ncbi:MAG: hypothetical protein ABI667_08350 [Sphingomicrobium sp.]